MELAVQLSYVGRPSGNGDNTPLLRGLSHWLQWREQAGRRIPRDDAGWAFPVIPDSIKAWPALIRSVVDVVVAKRFERAAVRRVQEWMLIAAPNPVQPN